MSLYASLNNNYHLLLTVIDIFSKFAWAVPLKTKSGQDVTNAMKSLLENSACTPKKFDIDRGTEFDKFNK